MDKDQKYTIGYSFKNKMGISANNFVILELIKDGSIMYTRKLQATEATTFDYTAPATSEYTWRMRSSSIGTTTTQPITYSLDNLSIFYSYPYTVENCDNLADGYRFGFNGKEKESDIYGESNAYDFGARIHDARIGRWLSVDPLQHKYVSLTPYHFVANSPIAFKDPDGKVIQVAGKYQEQFKEVLRSAFGEKASTDFSFDKNNMLQFNGTVGNYTVEEQKVLSCLTNLIGKNELFIIIYEKQLPKNVKIKGKDGEYSDVTTTDDLGGEGTIPYYKIIDGKKIFNGSDIYIDPAEEAGMEILVRKEKLYIDPETGEKTTIRVRGQEVAGYNYEYKTEKYSKYSRTFHGLGHAEAPNDPSNAVTIENAAGAIHKKLTTGANGNTQFEAAPIKPSECDENHCIH